MLISETVLSAYNIVFLLQIIPIRVTASGPLVWEVQQQINTVGETAVIPFKPAFSILQYINTTWRLFAPFSNSTGSSPDIFSMFAEWQSK